MNNDKKVRKYFIKAPIANADFFTENMWQGHELTEMSYINFYSDEYQTLVTPAGGIVVCTLSPDTEHYRTVEGGTFNAIDAYLETRLPPNAVGMVTRAKVNLSAVTGATHFMACFWRL